MRLDDEYSDGDPIWFELDDTPEYPGYAHGTTWNGWDNVYVTPEVRDRIVQDLREDWLARPVGLASDATSGIEDVETFTRGGEEFVSLGWCYVARITRRSNRRL